MTESVFVTVDRLSIEIKDIEAELDKVKLMSLEDAATYYQQFREKFDYIDAVRDKWASIKETLSTAIIPEIFERSAVDSSIKLKSGYRVGVSYRTTASMKDKIGGMKWLEENGLADLIQPTVSSSTLSSVAKNLIEENRSLPEEFFNVVAKPTTSVTKAK